MHQQMGRLRSQFLVVALQIADDLVQYFGAQYSVPEVLAARGGMR